MQICSAIQHYLTMRYFAFLIIFFIAADSVSSQTLGNPEELPFVLSIEEVTQDEIPGLHSFAFAKWDEWWVIIGGRINGLHGFFINTGFPEDQANQYIQLVNPQTGENHQFPVDDLNIPYRSALKSTNMQYTQDGQWLYMCGGFGKDPVQSEFVTFPVLTAINLDMLISGIIAGENPTAAFQQINAVNLQVCGGGMEKMGDWFYLVGGHDFSGMYNQVGPPLFTQTYTNEVRRFKISNSPTLDIAEFSAVRDSNHLHRRDFTLGPVIHPDGTEGLCLYGGVFRPDADLPYYNPVYIDDDMAPVADVTYSQIFSQYTCPLVPVFDAKDNSMYSIFFAGISANNWNENTGQLEYDEKVPFINDISTFRRAADGTSREYVMPLRFDALLGTNMVFVPNDSVPQFNNKVIKLDALNGPTFVGYLFGGIKAEIPNFTPSSASNRLFKVMLTPKIISGVTEIPGQELAGPNPFRSTDRFFANMETTISEIRIYYAGGSFAGSFRMPQNDGFEAVTQQLHALPSGAYFLEIQSEDAPVTVKLIRQ